MSDGGGTAKNVVVTFFPMAIAVLSLVTSIYNGWLNNKFVGIIQGNVGRVEYMRTCKEIIDAYFLVKVRVGLLADAARGAPAGAELGRERAEAEVAVAKFAALGTYLANLRDEAIRARYTELSRRLEALVRERGGSGDAATRFQAADTIFAELNADCVRSAKDMPL
ncbi:hypothetical protein CCR97_08610 [Rhodoplanes elegans]|uniref:Chemotaxis methyl-accepting receptor HlyB-like 4HB MCP domain-containing protein n=1 Tax=Rhodoplanes elegans TaxID=29408 RepID=A0A327KTE6_9BRAD|nr:hypothetical protein [Rhodoplanes elegans]MBK5958271.1 hypothetical protein [Rhodoplanes elegans]RAI40685.1 hypothetical protein CH338_05580 [Rhodoplanes elegans]